MQKKHAFHKKYYKSSVNETGLKASTPTVFEVTDSKAAFRAKVFLVTFLRKVSFGIQLWPDDCPLRIPSMVVTSKNMACL